MKIMRQLVTWSTHLMWRAGHVTSWLAAIPNTDSYPNHNPNPNRTGPC